MRRFPLQWCLATSLAAALLTSGCQYGRRSCPTCGMAAPPLAAAPAASSRSPYAPTMIAAPAVPRESEPSGSGDAPVMHTVAKPVSPEPPEAADEAVSKAAPVAAVEAEAEQPTVSPYTEKPVGRRTFTDITADPHFAHDPKYHWLVGTLDYSKVEDAWILRYCSVEEDDRYGGSVTLVDLGSTAALKNGQLVRVEGSLINADSTQLRPAFHVRGLRIVGP